MLDCSSYLRHNGQQNYSLEPLNSLQGSGHLGIIWPFGSDEKGEEEIDMPKPLRVMKEMARLARRQFSGGNTNGHGTTHTTWGFDLLLASPSQHTRTQAVLMKPRKQVSFRAPLSLLQPHG
jgi:hypothetical protein